MIRTVLFFAALGLSTFFFASCAVVCGLARAEGVAFDWIHRNWSRSLLWAAGVRVDATGLEHLAPDRAQIIAANHQSFFDIWAMMSALPVSLRFVAKAELSRIPVLAAAMRAAGHVFIRRDHAASAKETIRAANERMKDEGLTIVLFPEGTRSKDGELGRFRRGSFALALETDAHLIPVTVDGGREIFPKHSKRIRPGTMTIRVSPAVELAEKTLDDRDTLLTSTRDTISADLAAIRGAPT
ncbi:MAG: 1-acyl-sn-glycerol-3-phosphate acyltransferase [Gemmatimonadetes bacterium]|nr:1-acyl-sn-glycerol-3-phosphate acyltransferase [Gemmatimonadota bacterium]